MRQSGEINNLDISALTTNELTLVPDIEDEFICPIDYSDSEFVEWSDSDSDEAEFNPAHNNVFNLYDNQNADNVTLESKLAKWAIVENIPQSKLKKLLEILREKNIMQHSADSPKIHEHYYIPQKKNVLLKTLNLGSFYYLGIALSINNLINKYGYQILESSVKLKVTLT